MAVINEHHVFVFLIAFALLLGLSRALGIFLSRWKIPPMTAEIVVGVLLGPTVFGRFCPEMFQSVFPDIPLQKAMLETMSWVGIMLLLLVTGLEVNFSAVWKHRKPAFRLTIMDVIFPLVFSALIIFILPEQYFYAEHVQGPLGISQRILSTIFLAAIMAISALPVAIRAMHDLNLLKTDMGLVAITALSIHDIIGWIVFTIVMGIFSQGRADPLFILQVGAYTLAFATFALTVGRWAMDKLFWYMHKKQGGDNTGLSLTLLVVLGLIFGAITLAIGIHSLFGFFMAGVVCGEARKLSEKSRTTMTQFVMSVFVPLFFVGIGLKIDIVANFDLFLILFIAVLGTVARFGASYLGAWWGGLSHKERIPLGLLNMPGGAMHIVIANIALAAGLISLQLFVAIVFAAVVSSILLGPLLAATIPRIAIRKELVCRFISAPDVLQALNKQQALTALSVVAARTVNMNLQEVLDPVYQREELMTTAWQKGVAVPHARLDSLKEPLLVFGRNMRGIEWDTPDGLPVQLIFLVLTPPAEDWTHLAILKSLATMLKDDKIRNKLLENGFTDEIQELVQGKLNLAS